MHLWGGIKEFMRMWKYFFISIKYKPKEISYFDAINIFKSPVFYDMVRKTFSKLGFEFTRELKREMGHICEITLPDSNNLAFDWTERAEVLTTVDKVYKKKLYGEKPSGVIIDVGAHVGVYSKFASVDGKVYAIEPQSDNYLILCRNANEKIIPLQYAISQEEGTAKLYLSDLTSSSSLKSDGLLPKFEIVETIPLNILMRENSIDIVDMLKIDAEGFELEILKSAEEFIKTGKIKNMAIASYHYKNEAEMIVEYLESFGYNVKIDKRLEVIVFAEAQ